MTVSKQGNRVISGFCRKKLAGIHDPLGIQGGLDSAHQLDLDRGLVARDLLAPELAQAMLGADAAAMAGDHVMDQAIELTRPGEEIRRRHARRLQQIEVDIAVAEMAE